MKSKEPKSKSTKSAKRSRKYKRAPKTSIVWSHNLIVPDRYYVPLELELSAKIPQSAPASGFFYVQGNSLINPFGQNFNVYAAPPVINFGSTTGGNTNFTITASGANTMDFKGLSQLQLLYNKYKVNWSKLSILSNIGQTGDSMMMCIVPFSYAQAANFSGLKNMSYLTSLPYSKEKLLTNTSATKDQIISCSMSSKKILGLNKYQYGAIPHIPANGTDSNCSPDISNGWGYFVQYNVLTDSAIANANDTLVLKLRVLVEFTERIQSGIA